jgi:4-amino-4-deoxy-L-arabinose transferase-like glycosyltransferase
MLSILKNIKSNKILAYLLLASFFVCIAYSFVFRITPVVDAQAYDQIAQNILAGNGFLENADLDAKTDKAIIRVGPLYQYFLAGIYTVFGHNYEAVWIIQAILHVISAYLVYLSAKIIFSNYNNNEPVSLVATGIFAFFPDLIEISAMLMTETLYLFLWCLLIWYFLKFVNNNEILSQKSWIKIIILGIISGLAVLARPPVLFVLPVIFFYFLVNKKYSLLILLFLTIGIVFTPWTVRNYMAYEKIMPFGGAGGYNFWIGNHVGASGEQEKPEEVEDFIKENGAYLVSDKSIDEFKKFVVEYPGDFTRLTILRTNRYFSVIRPMGFWFYDSGFSQLVFVLSSALFSVILFVFGLAGIIKLWADKNNILVKYIFWFTVFTPLILFITVVETRYRFQIYPLVALFAGYGIISVFKDRFWWKNRIFLMSVFLIGINSLIDLLLSLDKLKEKLGLFM